MEQLNEHEAKARFPELVSRVELGEEIEIARHGRTVARLVPLGRNATRPRREFPAHHHDAFDRVLIAQAQLENLTTVTRDARFRLYDVPLLTA